MAASREISNFHDNNTEKVVGWGIDLEADDEEDEYTRERKRIQEQRREIEERSLRSTQRSMGYIDDSEKIGVNTAQELLEQREQLHRVGQNLEKMNDDLNTSQRHLNSIKSVFSSIGNYFKKGNNTNTAASGSPGAAAPSALEARLEQHQAAAGGGDSGPHPGLRVHSDQLPDGYTSQQQQQQGKPTSYDEAIDQNLDDMSVGMQRLRGLALGMQTELDDQNVLLDDLTSKVERVDPKITSQNRQMRKLLK